MAMTMSLLGPKLDAGYHRAWGLGLFANWLSFQYSVSWLDLPSVMAIVELVYILYIGDRILAGSGITHGFRLEKKLRTFCRRRWLFFLQSVPLPLSPQRPHRSHLRGCKHSHKRPSDPYRTCMKHGRAAGHQAQRASSYYERRPADGERSGE
eukprot:CAMPEP_0175721450 /NCGR_PEP_ID=MMETSP0097-20121207/45718_1 /TAXON_ID=311494 /ORGANISM="Alexandrium monilatum, Strain CCMP3105" /LENGTH=151 /DNA_ID=CAMNT_0017029129 /DNA_START=173 /DNA_END=625 /DNA_ORIENTATION=+